jgi:maleate isomerase
MTRLGFLVPPQNPTAEDELIALSLAMKPPQVSVHFNRLIAPPDRTLEERNRVQIERLPESARLLAMVHPKVIVLAHTVMSYMMGRDAEAQMASRIQRESGVPFVSAFGSILAALQHVGARRIAFCAPYAAASVAMAKAHFEAHGIAVVSTGNLEGVKDIYATTSDDAYALARRTDRADADAIVLSGTGMPVLDAIGRLERDLKKPVIAATAAMMWHALRVAGVAAHIRGFGRILSSSG